VGVRGGLEGGEEVGAALFEEVGEYLVGEG